MQYLKISACIFFIFTENKEQTTSARNRLPIVALYVFKHSKTASLILRNFSGNKNKSIFLYLKGFTL